MSPDPLANILGVNIIIVPDYTETVPAKMPRKRHSRRWRKKYLKKYGWKIVAKPAIPNGKIITYYNTTLYMNRHTYNALANHPEMAEWREKINATKNLLL